MVHIISGSSTFSKPFWLLQCIWQPCMVPYPSIITNCSHWNPCIWSQDSWKHKFLLVKKVMVFFSFIMGWYFFFENDISRLINIKYPINNINDLITNRFYWIWTTILAKIVPFSVHNINSKIMQSDFQESFDHRQQF